MRRNAIVGAATVAGLLLAVLAVRGGTAADEADLAGPPEPSPAPSEETGPDPVLLAADGLPGLRLGAAPGPGQGAPEAPTGDCWLTWEDPGGMEGLEAPPGGLHWDVGAWVVDDEVVSVVLGTWSDVSEVSQGLRTWLGPTLGSPVEAAQELPGARTVVERPFGAAGPDVSVVTVPEQGVEVVFSDVPVVVPGAQDEGGRITTIEVRKPAARPCSLADTFGGATDGSADGGGDSLPGFTVDVDGVGPLRLGASAEDLLDEDVVVAEPAQTGGRFSDGALADQADADTVCQPFTLALPPEAGGFVRAVALDGVVTEVWVSGPALTTSFGLDPGADADDVRARFPELAGVSDQLMGVANVDVDGVPVRLELQPEVVWLPDVERPVEGGSLRVGGIVLRTPGTPEFSC